MQRFREEENITPSTHYDSDSVRRVLARAAEIDAQRETETLTAVQVETLGRELGLSSGAVRRAMGEAFGTTRRRVERTLTQEEIRSALVPGLAYLPVLGLTLLWWQTVHTTNPLLGNLAVALLYTVLYLVPILSGLLYGWRKGDARLGMIAGTGVCFSWGLSLLLIATFRGNLAATLIMLLPIGLLGVALGSLGALARKRWNGLPRNSDR